MCAQRWFHTSNLYSSLILWFAGYCSLAVLYLFLSIPRFRGSCHFHCAVLQVWPVHAQVVSGLRSRSHRLACGCARQSSPSQELHSASYSTHLSHLHVLRKCRSEEKRKERGKKNTQGEARTDRGKPRRETRDENILRNREEKREQAKKNGERRSENGEETRNWTTRQKGRTGPSPKRFSKIVFDCGCLQSFFLSGRRVVKRKQRHNSK